LDFDFITPKVTASYPVNNVPPYLLPFYA